MLPKQILEELKHLTTKERLSIAEEALHLIHRDVEQSKADRSDSDRKRQLTTAAELLVSDYIAESDFSEYLVNLEDYENRLARGEISW